MNFGASRLKKQISQPSDRRRRPQQQQQRRQQQSKAQQQHFSTASRTPIRSSPLLATPKPPSFQIWTSDSPRAGLTPRQNSANSVHTFAKYRRPTRPYRRSHFNHFEPRHGFRRYDRSRCSRASRFETVVAQGPDFRHTKIQPIRSTRFREIDDRL